MKEYLLKHINSSMKDSDDKLQMISNSMKLKGETNGLMMAYSEEAAIKRTLTVIKFKVETYES